MRVLFDGYWWVEGPPSGTRTADSFLRTWLADWPGDDVAVAVPRRDAEVVRRRVEQEGLALRVHTVRRGPHGISAMTELGRVAEADVVLAHNFTPLRTDALRATFVHDLMFVEHPEYFSRAERLYLAAIPWSARRADLVLTSSQAEADRIARLRPRLAARVRPVGLAVPAAFATAVATGPGGLDVVPGRFLLCVGRLNVRKNVDRLIDALTARGVLTEEAPLVVVGEPDGLALRGTDPADRRVRFVGGVDDGVLRWLYENCRLFVFPSLDEGFGLPVLEAALAGAPMVLSDIPPFRELAPRACFFDPRDERSIADAVATELGGRRVPTPGVRVDSWSDVVARMREAVTAERAVRG